VVEMAELDEPAASESDVVVEVRAAGICGSDVHAARDGGLLRAPPLVMGHEFAGTYHGRRVAINPMLSCGTCVRCVNGQSHLCENRSIVGIQRAGGLAPRVAVPESSLVDLPEHVSYEAGAMVEPLAVAHHAVNLSPAGPEDRVGILGAGTIGLMVAHLVTEICGNVSIADPNHHRLGFAKGLGVAAASETLTGTFDVVFDAVGSATTHRLSLEHLRPGGTTVWVGNEDPDPAFDAQMLVRIEQRILGSAAYTPEDFEMAASKVDDQLLEWAEVRPLEEAPDVIYSLMEPAQTGPVKVLFRP
jgi:threonine dehydrogenase-like Zn-dependent dehydrogenase